MNVADTWEFKTITVAGDTGGTWQTGTGVGLYLNICIAGGASRVDTAGAWTGADYSGATSTTNGVAATSDTFQITGVIVLPGIELPDFTQAPRIMRPFTDELSLCQRYFEKSAALSTPVLTANDATFLFTIIASSVANGAGLGDVRYKTRKRPSAAVVTYPYTTPTNTGRISSNGGVDYGAGSGATLSSGEGGFSVYNTTGGAMTISQNQVILGWYADARLV